jgi:3-deoxy-manno-octulosonate cytidylyltransferase (CMP-KDO synthetase)
VDHTAKIPLQQAVAIIPARYNSSRLPGKALAEINGRAMILRVVDRVSRVRDLAGVYVATDDARVFDCVEQAGYRALMTSSSHATGTDRLAEAAALLPDAEIIVNVQGDEPLIATETVELALDAMRNDTSVGIVTTAESISGAADVLSPDVVKVVTDAGGFALYFSRQPIPFPREFVRTRGSLAAALAAHPELLETFRKHTGLYVYRRAVLLAFSNWPQSALELSESLEQLRALERGVTIRVVESAYASIGVDTEADLELVRTLVAAQEAVIG